MICCCCCCCCGTQHVPAGEIARHALPGQGAREQSAGVTLAGRVPTTTEAGGGGGGGAWWWGGGGVCVGKGGATCELPWCPPPSRGGRVTRPVRSGCGGGGGRGGDLGVGKACPGPRSLRALPEHPAEVAVPRVWPWRGRGRWPVRLAFCGGEGRPGSCFLPAPGHLCKCCGVAASSPVVRARARASVIGERGHKGGSTRALSWVRGCWRVVYGSGAVPWCLSLCPACGRPRGTTGGGSRPGPGAWVAAGGRRWPRVPHTVGSVGAPGACAPRRSGCGGRMRKGVGVPDEGPTVGRGTCGKLVALPGGRARGRARG